MLGLILRALATRRAATLTLLVLTVLSAGAAAAAPQYVAGAMGDLAEARAEAAPVAQRVLERADPDTRRSPHRRTGWTAFAEEVAAALPLPGVDPGDRRCRSPAPRPANAAGRPRPACTTAPGSATS